MRNKLKSAIVWLMRVICCSLSFRVDTYFVGQCEARLSTVVEMEVELRALQQEAALAQASIESLKPRLDEALGLQESCTKAVQELAAERDHSCARAKEVSNKVQSLRVSLSESVDICRQGFHDAQAAKLRASSQRAAASRHLEQTRTEASSRVAFFAARTHFALTSTQNALEVQMERADAAANDVVRGATKIATAIMEAMRHGVAGQSSANTRPMQGSVQAQLERGSRTMDKADLQASGAALSIQPQEAQDSSDQSASACADRISATLSRVAALRAGSSKEQSDTHEATSGLRSLRLELRELSERLESVAGK